MDFASVLFIIVAMAYVIGGVVQCVRPLNLSEYTSATAKPFRIVSIFSCFVAAIGCVFVAMGTSSSVLSLVGCAILIITLIVEVIYTNKLVLKDESQFTEKPSKTQKQAKEETNQEYEPYEDEELEEIEDEMRSDDDEDGDETDSISRNRQID